MSTILFVCSELQRGGAERQWAHLLPALRKRGFEPRVLALRDTGPFYDELAASGISVACARMTGRFDLGGLRRAFTAAGRPALVVSQGTNALVVGEAIATRRRVPHATIEHTPPGLERRPHRRLLTRALGRAVDRIVAVSDAQLSELASLGYARSRMTLIRNGVPPLVPSRSRDETRALLGIEPGDVAVMLVATLRPQKDVPLFLDAVDRATKIEPRIRAFVAGGGPLLGEIQELAAGGPTTVLGERDDVGDLLAAADVVCLSSRTEAMPMVLLEAMAAGRPVLATDVGGNREVVVERETGLLVPSGDADAFAGVLVQLARDADQRGSMGEAAAKRHQDLFSLGRMVDEYQSLLEGELRRTR